MGTYQDGLSVGKYRGRASDALTDQTKYIRTDDDTNALKDNDDNDNDNVKDISFYCDEYSSENEECNDSDKSFHCSYTRLIEQSNITESSLVDARLSSEELIFQDSSNDDGVAMLATALEEEQNNRNTGTSTLDITYYDTVLRLISGTLLGGGKY